MNIPIWEATCSMLLYNMQNNKSSKSRPVYTHTICYHTFSNYLVFLKGWITLANKSGFENYYIWIHDTCFMLRKASTKTCILSREIFQFKFPCIFRISCFSYIAQLMESIFLLIEMFIIIHYLEEKKGENISLLKKM